MRKNLIEQIDWQKCNDLVPTIIQNIKSYEVLMLGFMNQEALKLTQESGKVHFFSRTKKRIWMKGEESGNILNIIDIKLDCDNDALLILVDSIGNTCHKDTKSCFNYKINFLAEIENIIADRIKNPNEKSYISKLAKSGINKVAQKIGEEATEVVIAALNESDKELIAESADLLFHLIITLKIRNLELNDIVELLEQRNKKALLSINS